MSCSSLSRARALTHSHTLWQAELEDTILALLSAAEGSLLDNVALINTLDQSKTTWEEVNQSLKVGQLTALLQGPGGGCGV
jgi:hypothetical protein